MSRATELAKAAVAQRGVTVPLRGGVAIQVRVERVDSSLRITLTPVKN